jgi:hypothetical protein
MTRLAQLKVILAGLALFVVASAQGMVISFSPPSQTTGLGGNGSVDIVVSGRGGVSVGAFSFDVLFDSSIISALSIVFGDRLGDPLLEAFSTGDVSVPGTASLAEVSFLLTSDLDALQTTDSFVLATLNYTAVGVGSTALTFSGIEISDGDGNLVAGVTGSTGAVEVVRSVPEPGTMALVLACLAAAGLLTRLRQRKTNALS